MQKPDIAIIFDFPWLVLGTKQLDPEEVVIFAAALQTEEGRRYLERARKESEDNEREAGR